MLLILSFIQNIPYIYLLNIESKEVNLYLITCVPNKLAGN